MNEYIILGGLAISIAVNAGMIGLSWGSIKTEVRNLKEDYRGTREEVKELGKDVAVLKSQYASKECP